MESESACVYCDLRLKGIESASVYQDVVPTSTDTKVCFYCFDILLILAQNAQKLLNSVETAGYDSKDFALSVKIPSSTLLRQAKWKKQTTCLKDAIKWIMTPLVSKALGNAEYKIESDLTVAIQATHDASTPEVIAFLGEKKAAMKSRKKKRSEIVPGYGEVARGIEEGKELPSLEAVTDRAEVVIQATRGPVYLKGRYLKYERGLSQTPWFIDGVRYGTSSLEEKISHTIVSRFKGTGSKFHSAGREDIDVRMLGTGRPCIIEILDAKKTEFSLQDYKDMMAEINKLHSEVVEIRDLALTNRTEFAQLQTGADSKRKTYCCVIWVSKKLSKEDYDVLNAIKDLTLYQKTPEVVRVLHRRTAMTREKIIHEASCEPINSHYMILRLTTSAGTYVKEFVHGDFGRTLPNVGSLLGCKADILQLDVESIITD